MSIEVFDVEQGSDEWVKLRLGVPTASQFDLIMATGRSGGESVQRRRYLHKLAGERLTGEPTEEYRNKHLDRGKEMEAEARESYAFITAASLQRVGFVRNGIAGCSPDALIDTDGGLEIKTALPHILIEHIRLGKFPAEHFAQCQGCMMITGRKWWDIAVYWPGLPLFIKRTEADEAYHERLYRELSRFDGELNEVVRFISQYG